MSYDECPIELSDPIVNDDGERKGVVKQKHFHGVRLASSDVEVNQVVCLWVGAVR